MCKERITELEFRFDSTKKGDLGGYQQVAYHFVFLRPSGLFSCKPKHGLGGTLNESKKHANRSN